MRGKPDLRIAALILALSVLCVCNRGEALIVGRERNRRRQSLRSRAIGSRRPVTESWPPESSG